MPQTRRRRSILFEALESRILLSADLAGGALIDSFVPSNELYVLDSAIVEHHNLAERPGHAFLVLDRELDGVGQIAQALAARPGVTGLHIFSHGAEGSLTLGATTLGAANLEGFRSELLVWGKALAADADILLYGCNVAGSAAGIGFIEELSRATGADVAASTDLTGSAGLGGDWDLEYRSGSIETAVAADAIAGPLVLGTINYDAATDTLTFTADNDEADLVTVTSPGANQLRIQVGNGDTLSLSGDTGAGFVLAPGDVQLDISTSAAPVALFRLVLDDADDGRSDSLAFTNTAANGLGSVVVDSGGGSDAVILTAASGTLSGSLSVAAAQDLSVTASAIGRNVTVAAGGSVTLGAVVGQTVVVTATAGAIVDTDADLDLIATVAATLSAGTTIGDGNALETNVAAFANLTTGNGGVFISELDGVTLSAATIGGGGDLTINAGSTVIVNGALQAQGDDIIITASTGNIQFAGTGRVDTGAAGSVQLTALGTNGTIFDQVNNLAVKVRTGSAVLSAAAAVGSNTALGLIDTDVGSLSGTTTASGGGHFIQEANALDIGTITSSGTGSLIAVTAGGNITLGLVNSRGTASIVSTAGSILDGDADVDLIAISASLSASLGIGASGAGAIDTDVTSLSSLASPAGGVFINEVDTTSINGLTLSVVNAGAGQVEVTTARALIDGNTGATNIFAGSATLKAGTSIGSAADPLELSVGTLDLSSATAGSTIRAANLGNASTARISVASAADDVLVSINGGAIDSVTIADTLSATFGVKPTLAFTAAAGDLRIGAIANAAQAVTLTASGGSIVDDGNEATAIAAGTLSLNAAGGIGGAGDADIDVDATRLNIAAGAGANLGASGGTTLGTLAAGGDVLLTSPGVVVIDGSVAIGTYALSIASVSAAFSINASLQVDIGGTAAGEFTSVALSGPVTLGGTLHADLVNGFLPASADRFRIITSAARLGSFDATDLPADFFVDLPDSTVVDLLYAPTPTISIGDAAVTEGDSGTTTAAFTVSLSDVSARNLWVDFATADGTAVAGADYDAATGQLFFGAGETSKQILVTVLGDMVDEPDETFTLELLNPTNVLIGDAQGVGTIIDDDDAPTISIADAVVTEGDGGATSAAFNVTLSNASAQAVTVDFATSDGTATAGSDYDAATGTLTFAPGETSKQIFVTVNGDLVDESDETFTVALFNAINSAIGSGPGTGAILDDDAAPMIFIADGAVIEGNSGTTSAAFGISLSSASSQAITVDFAASDGTATAGSDYDAATGTLTFAPGETFTQIFVTVNGDLVDEFNETFTVSLSNAINSTIASGSGTGLILDDDDTPTISIGDAVVTEGNTGTTSAAFTVSLSNASSQTIMVDFATANVTATAGSDYNASTGTLAFAPGETSRQISVTVNGDLVDEFDETFKVTLFNAINALLADAQGTGTIIDDDTNAAPVANPDTFSVDEDGTLTISAPGVLGNDTDADGNALTASLVSAATNGVLTFNADGSFSYTPNSNFNGTDSFTYKANDAALDSGLATVTLLVNAVNDAPVANPDTFSVDEDGTLTSSAPGVLGNDTDVDNTTLTATLVSTAANGALTFNSDGSFTYTPNSNFNGTDSFTYKANDAALDSGLATVTLTVVANENQAPDIQQIVVPPVTEGTVVRFNVTATDADDALASLVFTAGGLPAGASFNPTTREFLWIPADNTTASVTFTVSDPHGAADTMTVALEATNAAPTVDAGPDQVVGLQKDHDDDKDDKDDKRDRKDKKDKDKEEATVAIAATFNDLGTRDTHKATIDWGDGTKTAGSVAESPFGPPGSPAGANGTVNGTHDYKKAGTYTVKVTVTDDDGGSRTDTLTVTVKEPAKDKKYQAREDRYEVKENGVLRVGKADGVLDNDSGPAGAQLLARVVDGPQHGKLVFNADGSFTYTPERNYDGKDSFWYEFTDGKNVSKAVMVELKIEAPKRPHIDWHGKWCDGDDRWSPFGAKKHHHHR